MTENDKQKLSSEHRQELKTSRSRRGGNSTTPYKNRETLGLKDGRGVGGPRGARGGPRSPEEQPDPRFIESRRKCNESAGNVPACKSPKRHQRDLCKVVLLTDTLHDTPHQSVRRTTRRLQENPEPHPPARSCDAIKFRAEQRTDSEAAKSCSVFSSYELDESREEPEQQSRRP
ncbi:unnamed protein product [Pleuronectes platessa]|uniref:Uncharacterized protein n=1 Tax=Pleuronectes platessa TaxID=8262 RepID=A0A9N7VHM2_PLEPL|nr:unnamed protein product [Pleuronectes platessa]